jgi:hypothetical protein
MYYILQIPMVLLHSHFVFVFSADEQDAAIHRMVVCSLSFASSLHVRYCSPIRNTLQQQQQQQLCSDWNAVVHEKTSHEGSVGICSGNMHMD